MERKVRAAAARAALSLLTELLRGVYQYVVDRLRKQQADLKRQ
jgi:hypothetical protein